VLALKKFVGFFSFHTIGVCAPLLLVAFVMVVATGCSSRKRKSRQPDTPTITTTTLPEGEVGVAYPATQLKATGGTPPYTWSDVNNTLQTYGLTLDASTGEIGGTPNQATPAGGVTVTIQVTDANSNTGQKDFTLVIYPELQIATTSLPDAPEGVAYSHAIQATGGNSSSYNWSISGQPSWLSIDASTGELSGTPPTGSAGTYTFTVEVTDGQQTASKQFDLVVQSGGGTTLKADFEANPTQGTAPLTVNFTDKSTGNITQWEWDFDSDGTPDSTQQNPTHTYNNPGWYTVKLTVSDGTSSDTCVKEKYILVASGIYYVNGVNGDDANGGTGWGDAFATIGKALSVAGDYDLVLVADATYNETDLNFNGKKIYLKGVDHNNAGQQPVIDCQSSGRALLFDLGETKNSVVDNFILQNGKKNGTSYPDNAGGAILCENKSSPTIINCTFSGNSANDGGAILCSSSSPTITNCVFSGNSASSYGGVIRCWGASSPTVTNCTFSGNSANDGGAICCQSGSSPTLTNCTFSGNTANCGGAIHCFFSGSPTVTDCTFSGNSADEDGGAIYCDSNSSPSITGCTFSGNSTDDEGGAIYCSSSSPTITNCVFSGNSANDSGGAICCHKSSSPTITNCAFSSNGADEYGGAICCDSSSPTITNCTFNGNSVNWYGGAICCDWNSSPILTNCIFSGNSATASHAYGGAILCWNSSSPTITNCTFSGNTANWDAGAIYCLFNSSPTLNNCILWGNTAVNAGSEIYIYDSGSSCTLNYCCVDNTGYGGQTGKITENNCVFADPEFVDAAGGDYHLKDTSPCIDAGDNSSVPSNLNKDIDGNPRIVDGNNNGSKVVDIGAYEYQP